MEREVQAGPSRPAAVALLGLAAVLLVVGVVTDPAGALLALPAAAVAALLGLRDLLLVPVLHADAAGLRLVTGLQRRQLAWAEVQGLRVVTDRRALLLEVEAADERVVLLSRSRLGRDPRDVLEELQRLRS
ncbi:MAG: Bacterial domain [Frankiales bacterium]|nr:Bacterial domain [Frankiales bacterium]